MRRLRGIRAEASSIAKSIVGPERGRVARLRLVPYAAFLLFVAAGTPVSAQSLKVSESMEVLEERARRDSNDAAAHYNLAMGYLSKDRYAQAEASLRQAVALDPEFADAYLALAIVWLKDGAYWRAKRSAGPDTLLAAVRQVEREEAKAFLLDPLVDLRIVGSVVWSRGWGDLEGGLKDLFQGKYASAYEHFDAEVRHQQKGEGLSQVPLVLLWFRSLAAVHCDRLEDAAGDLTVLVSRAEQRATSDSFPDAAPLLANEYRYLLAAVRQREGKTSEAVTLYREVITNDIGNYMAHVQLARMYEATKDYKDALQERQDAVNANPDDPILLLDLGETFGKAGMMPEAEARLRLATEGNPRDARPYYWLAFAQLSQGKNAEAKASFSRFLELAPSRYDRQITIAKERLAQLQ